MFNDVIAFLSLFLKDGRIAVNSKKPTQPFEI